MSGCATSNLLHKDKMKLVSGALFSGIVTAYCCMCSIPNNVACRNDSKFQFDNFYSHICFESVKKQTVICIKAKNTASHA